MRKTPNFDDSGLEPLIVKKFKAAIGHLYKQSEINIESDEIRLRDKTSKKN